MMYQYRALPCPNFSKEDILIIQGYGFLTFPQFIDNGFKTKGGLRWKKAVKNAEFYRPLFFIANDDDPLKDFDILSRHCGNLILPLHKKNDLDDYEDEFIWIGFPNNKKLRDYDITWFLKNTEAHMIWWLGLHEYPENNPGYIALFDGLDSTLPELYAGKYGKIWRSWRDYYKPGNKLHWRIIFEQNVQNFRLFLDGIKPNGKYLEEYLS